MSDDEILRTAGRLIAGGYPPDAFISCFTPVGRFWRLREPDRLPVLKSRYRKGYKSVGSLRGTLPNPDAHFGNYEDAKRRHADFQVVETVEIPVRIQTIKEAVWDVKEAEEAKRVGKAALRFKERNRAEED